MCLLLLQYFMLYVERTHCFYGSEVARHPEMADFFLFNIALLTWWFVQGVWQ